MRIRDGIHTYDVDWDDGEPMSVHVVDTTGKTVLVGGGAAASTSRLVDIADDHDVDVVVSEHGDPDHMNAIPGLRDARDVAVAVPEADVQFYDAVGIQPDYLLQEHDSYWGLETIPTPGHTPGNMAFLVEDVLIAGDTVVGTDSRHCADESWSGPLGVTPPDYNPDDEQMRDSVRTLLDYEFDVVLVSHGNNVLEDGSAAVRTLVADLF